MQVLTVTANHTLEIQDIPKPSYTEYECLVKIKACGVCSTTDREIIKGTQPYHNAYPCVLGHEAIGEVIELGSKVKTFKPGNLVTRPTAIPPGSSRDGFASGWGGFAEYGTVIDRRAMEADGIFTLVEDYTALRQNRVPEGVSVKEAVLAISLAETASWVWLQPSAAGKNVIIFGTGIAGLSIALWWKMAGAANVTMVGRRDERLEQAKEIAADHVINITITDPAETLQTLTGGKADLAAEAVGSREVMKQALSSLGNGGTVAIYGVPDGFAYELPMGICPGDFNISLKPAEEHLAYDWVCRMIRSGKIPVDKLMTHEFDFADYSQAFDQIAQGNVIKSLLKL
jgi:threonine dehydrogenase-like Zn-dependent dehydrogenase